MTLILGCLGALCLTFAGCIEGARRATETTSADSAATDGDASAEDGADAGADVAPEVAGQPCATAGDCTGEAPLCRRWECPAGTCRLTAADGEPCDDGDRCTGAGVCEGGACTAGLALTCEGGTACSYAVCDPVSGCGLEVALDGYCDNGRDVSWGSCQGLRMHTIDGCTGEDLCAEGVTGLDVPLPKDLVVGRWFVVSQSQGHDEAGSAAGVVDFGVGGALGGALETTAGRLELANVAHDWCLDARNGVAFDLGPAHYVGQVDPQGEVLAAGSQVGASLLVGVRPEGGAADVDGVYAALLTATGNLGQLQVWSGYLSFSRGCLADATFLAASPGGDALFIADNGACLGVPILDVMSLELELENGGAPTTPLSLFGAVGARGEVALFNERERGGSGFGILLLVRTSPEAAARVAGRTGWVQLVQEARAGQFIWSLRSVAGALLVDDGRLVNGFFGDDFIIGERLAVGDDGRFVIEVRTDGEHHDYAGSFAPGGGIGFFYEVTPPSDWSSVDEVSEIPALPTAGLLVQRPRL